MTDRGPDKNGPADDEQRTTEYIYDDAAGPGPGLLDRTVLYNGALGGDVISVRDVDYDNEGRLRRERVLKPDGVTVLSQSELEYSSDGFVTAVVDGPGVSTKSTYDTAGLLTKTVRAAGQQYFSLYTGQLESVEMTTTYSYYADGTLRQTMLPRLSSEDVYVDPASRTGWTVTGGVSDGPHTVSGSSIVFHDAGRRVVTSALLDFGHKTKVDDLASGGSIQDAASDPRSSLPVVTRTASGPPGHDLLSLSHYDARGQLRVQDPAERGAVESVYEEIGSVTQTADLANSRLIFSSRASNPAGDLVETREVHYSPLGWVADLLLPLPSSWLSTTYVTSYLYDDQGRLRKTVDPLADGQSGVSDELGASPATVDYAYDAAESAMKVTTRSRTGAEQVVWLDALGRPTKERNAWGAQTTYQYDLAGNVVERQFTHPSGQLHRTTWQYDPLGRRRATVEHLAEPLFTATDYFLPGTPGADDWSLVEFLPQAGTDPQEFRNKLSGDGPERLKDLATRTRSDALGQVFFTQQPDPTGSLEAPDARPDDTPTRLVTYSQHPALGATVVTTRLAGAANYRSADGQAPLEVNEGTRVTREVTDALGRTVLTAARLSEFSQSDHLPVTSPSTDGYSHFIGGDKGGFVVLARHEYDPVTGNVIHSYDGLNHKTQYEYYADSGLVKNTTDPLGHQTSYRYDSRGNLVSETDALGRRTSYRYDALDRVVEVRDALGNRTTHIHQGKTTTTVDALGQSTTTTTDPAARRTVLTDALGHVTTTIYDGAGNVLSVEDARHNVTSYDYDGLGRLIRETRPDPDGPGQPLPAPVTRYEYEMAGNLDRVVEVIDPAATPPVERIVDHDYDRLGRKVQTTLPDPDGAGPLPPPVTRFRYDPAGNLLERTQAIDPANSAFDRVVTYTYDGLDRKTKETIPDPDNIPGGSNGPLVAPVTEYAYNAAGSLIGRRDPGDRISTWLVDPLGRIVQYRDALHNATASDLAQAVGQLPAWSSGACDDGTLSHVTFTCYDGVGNVQSSRDPLDRKTVYGYDRLNRPVSVTDPLGHVTKTTYDAVGNVVSVADPLGHKTTYVYDALRRLDQVIDAEAGLTRYSYDAVGNRQSLTDAVGNTTTWIYDNLDRVSQETNAPGQTRTFVYDAAGNVHERTDRNGRTIRYTYDELDRLQREQWLGAGGAVERTIDSTYNAAGLLSGVADPDAGITLDYDQLGRLTSATQNYTGLSGTLQLTELYNQAGQRRQLTASVAGGSDFVREYVYDLLGRLTELKQHGAAGGAPVAEKRVNLAYDDAGQFDTIERFADLAGTASVVAADYTFDAAGRLEALGYTQGATVLAGYDWDFDQAGRLTRFAYTCGGCASEQTADYAYDDTNQLTGADYSTQADEAYQYDANGNRQGSGYATGAGNRTTSDGTYAYAYDGEGNRTARFVDTDASGSLTAGDTDITEYTWDHRQRLVRLAERAVEGGAATQIVDYVYDALGRRITRSLDTDGNGTADQVSHYLHDGLRASRDQAGDHVVLVLDESGAVTRRYLHGPAVDQILADEEVDPATGQTERLLWPLADHLGTVRDLAERDGTSGVTSVANRRSYDAFGQLTAETDAAVDHLFGFTGRETDTESGLAFYRARYYDPALGQFIGEDPMGFDAGDANLRRYVGNRVTNASDPSGLQDTEGLILHVPVRTAEEQRARDMAFVAQMKAEAALAEAYWRAYFKEVRREPYYDAMGIPPSERNMNDTDFLLLVELPASGAWMRLPRRLEEPISDYSHFSARAKESRDALEASQQALARHRDTFADWWMPERYIHGWRDYFDSLTSSFSGGYFEYRAYSAKYDILRQVEGDLAAWDAKRAYWSGVAHDHSLVQLQSDTARWAATFIRQHSDTRLVQEVDWLVVQNHLATARFADPESFTRGLHSAFFWEVNAEVAMSVAGAMGSISHVDDARYILLPRRAANLGALDAGVDASQFARRMAGSVDDGLGLVAPNSGTVRIYRKMSAAEAEATLSSQRLQPRIPGTNSRKYVSESLEKVRNFDNKAVTPGTREVIVEFEVDAAAFQPMRQRSLPQHGNGGSSEMLFNLEGLEGTNLRNFGIPEAQRGAFNGGVKNVRIIE